MVPQEPVTRLNSAMADDNVEIHYCWGCSYLHLANTPTFCQGSYHQCRRSRCAEDVVYRHGKVELEEHSAWDMALRERVQAAADEVLAARAAGKVGHEVPTRWS